MRSSTVASPGTFPTENRTSHDMKCKSISWRIPPAVCPIQKAHSAPLSGGHFV